MKKILTKEELFILKELRETIYQGLPLIDLVYKNFVDQDLTAEQTSNVLCQLQFDGKINLSEAALNYQDFDRIIVEHYSLLHSGK